MDMKKIVYIITMIVISLFVMGQYEGCQISGLTFGEDYSLECTYDGETVCGDDGYLYECDYVSGQFQVELLVPATVCEEAEAEYADVAVSVDYVDPSEPAEGEDYYLYVTITNNGDASVDYGDITIGFYEGDAMATLLESYISDFSSGELGTSESAQISFGPFTGPAETTTVTVIVTLAEDSVSSNDVDVVTIGPEEAADSDGDGLTDDVDNCPDDSNADQADTDSDGAGDACDDCPEDSDNDIDGDGVCGNEDNCVDVANSGQEDSDGDGEGDDCDSCPEDSDNDIDGDGVCGNEDNCVDVSNDLQTDTDEDGEGDECDDDDDGDGIDDDSDNCPLVENADQEDADGDGEGDVCDGDADGDNIADEADNCPEVANEDQVDTDEDDLGDDCDSCPNDADNDSDGDNVCGDIDNCPSMSNSGQNDLDGDGEGDACDSDDDGDDVADKDDNCPDDSNPTQTDYDGDDIGKVCDPCEDTDYGENVYDKGHIYKYGTLTYTDYCVDGNYGSTVMEYSCPAIDLGLGKLNVLNTVSSSEMNCGSNYFCYNGECVKCHDTDGGNYYVGGTAYSPQIVPDGSDTDECTGDKLYEAYCDEDGNYDVEMVTCEDGCNNAGNACYTSDPIFMPLNP